MTAVVCANCGEELMPEPAVDAGWVHKRLNTTRCMLFAKPKVQNVV